MNRMKCLIMALMFCLLLVMFSQSVLGQDGDDVADQNDVDSVIIALTRLDVNDLILDVNDQTTDANDESPDPNREILNIDEPTLELRWKIKNNSDQDIWICDSVGWIEDEFEMYLKDDDQTLLIRRRLDVPSLVIHYISPKGWYTRLRAGKEHAKSLSINLPVHNNWIFIPRLEKQGVIYSRRLVVEIGYHTKDLAKMILDFQESDEDPNMLEKARIPYLSPLSEGEYVLRITVDGVLIPYEGTELPGGRWITPDPAIEGLKPR